MGDKLGDIAENRETLVIFLLYRTISIIVLTAVYILIWHKNITYSKVYVIVGMLLSSTVGTFLYKHNYPDNNIVIVFTIILESLAYNIFIVLSGGLSSPYLWYYINLFIIIISLKPFGKYAIVTSTSLMLLMLVSVYIEKRIRVVNVSQNIITYSDINTGIAFIVVFIGFYLILKSNDKLQQSRAELYELNLTLKIAKKNSDYALKHTINVYDALNLFSISNPQKVIDELNSMLYRTIAKGGCALFKISSMHDIVAFSYEGIEDEHQSEMAAFIIETLKFKQQIPLPSIITIDNKVYEIKFIKNSSNLLAILFISKGTQDSEIYNYEIESKFYLNLVKVIMQESDIQSMLESYIVSQEQNRIASEIHDIVIQKLFFIACNTKTLERKIDNTSPEDLRMRLNDIVKSTESTMETLREAIYGMKWNFNDENTFENKLLAYVQEARDMNDIDISLKLDENISILTSNKKTSLYRIICEALNNSIRHGEASDIHISVTIENGFVIACIADNGKGFDKKNMPKDRQGIKNMHMISEILKGTLSINSKLYKGTEITCRIPI